jgi:hypothetical protein
VQGDRELCGEGCGGSWGGGRLGDGLCATGLGGAYEASEKRQSRPHSHTTAGHSHSQLRTSEAYGPGSLLCPRGNGAVATGPLCVCAIPLTSRGSLRARGDGLRGCGGGGGGRGGAPPRSQSRERKRPPDGLQRAVAAGWVGRAYPPGGDDAGTRDSSAVCRRHGSSVRSGAQLCVLDGAKERDDPLGRHIEPKQLEDHRKHLRGDLEARGAGEVEQRRKGFVAGGRHVSTDQPHTLSVSASASPWTRDPNATVCVARARSAKVPAEAGRDAGSGACRGWEGR